MPKNYSIPEGLKVYLSSIKSEIQDPRNRNKVYRNIPQDELIALKELTNFKKTRKIVIKACNEGAGLIILNFEDYMKQCYIHLSSLSTNGRPNYTEVENIATELAKNKIK